MGEPEHSLNEHGKPESKFFKIPHQYRNQNGEIDKNQLHDDLDQYELDNIQALINEFLRRLQEVNPNNGDAHK